MDTPDAPKIRQLRLAVHDTLAALEELLMVLRVAYRSPEAVAAEELTARLLHAGQGPRPSPGPDAAAQRGPEPGPGQPPSRPDL
ncbi:hypothetical protein PSQ40_04570 [Curvibacter sp. HBC61]|uniref:Uncharacterized protein n=1 Tax=Curvibacter cyanobacteriorum TaxID=3026422 RepID=A0ABT5MUW7_9BURK|nr:hypothetical protein [Curvibacter sp. HBC61]MDD0837839.1 hypothetical protein [Curvibacter sp. HBC61]